jgi:hypothetical protein
MKKWVRRDSEQPSQYHKERSARARADAYGVSTNLEKLGVPVEYMGQPLTEFLKNDNFRIITL